MDSARSLGRFFFYKFRSNFNPSVQPWGKSQVNFPPNLVSFA